MHISLFRQAFSGNAVEQSSDPFLLAYLQERAAGMFQQEVRVMVVLSGG